MTPVEEWPVDLNGDGRFDELRFNFTFQVNVSWTYDFEGSLRSLDSGYLGGDYVSEETYSVGTYVRTITVHGWRMAWSGTDGPYRLAIFAFKVYESDHGPHWVGVDARAYATSPYAASDFDPPYARFATPFSDNLREGSPGGNFDLVVHVHFEVEWTSTLTVFGTIQGPGEFFVCSDLCATTKLVASRGPLSLDLVFNGTAFAAAKVSGPYLVQVYMSVYENDFRNVTYHRTNAYNYSAFLGPQEPANPSPFNAIVVGTASAAGAIGSVATFLLLRRHRRRRGVRTVLETEDLEPPAP